MSEGSLKIRIILNGPVAPPPPADGSGKAV
jgi:hypothetical protein